MRKTIFTLLFAAVALAGMAQNNVDKQIQRIRNIYISSDSNASGVPSSVI